MASENKEAMIILDANTISRQTHPFVEIKHNKTLWKR